MEYKSHRIGGAAAGAVSTVALLGIPQDPSGFVLSAGLIGVSMIGSLFPDIDHSQSKISKSNPILSLFITIFLNIGKLITSVLLLLAFWIPKRRKDQILKGFEHRGIFHTLLMGVIFYFLIGLIPINNIFIWQIAFCGGYLSHILMDMLTVSGVRLFYPFLNVPCHLLPFVKLKTGNKFHEWLARIIFILSAIVIIYFIKG